MDTMVKAKLLTGIDDGGFMYKKINLEYICPQCFSVLKRVVNPEFKVSQKKGCFRYTYDGYCIVSEEFKLFCDVNEYPEIAFIEIIKSPGYYYFMPKQKYLLDPVRRNVEFINYCDNCGNYEEVIGMTPAFTKEGFSIDSNDFIYRSDLAFGSRERKSPAVIVGLETVKKMRNFGLTKIYFKDVYI